MALGSGRIQIAGMILREAFADGGNIREAALRPNKMASD
jgi:hypothetical protein